MDPYKILGVSESDSDEKIKDVYRELCRKYHPDVCSGLSKEQAEAKMAEINAAYDEIMLRRKRGGSYGFGGSYNTGGSYYQGGYSQSQYADVRRLINERRIAQAEEILEGVPSYSRGAEWHFLKGTILYSRGWMNDAFTHFETATRMEPQNREYSAAYQQMFSRRNGQYNPGGYRTSGNASGCDACDMCSCLMCSDCCCEAMGGDCIRCL